MPGYDVVTGLKQHISDDTYRRSTMLSRDYQTDEERKFDAEWYWRADLNNVTSVSLVSPVTPLKPMAKLAYEKARALYYKDHALKNVDFATRVSVPPIGRRLHGVLSGMGKTRTVTSKPRR